MSREEAFLHLRAGRPQDAADLLVRHLAVDARDARSWFLLGACRHQFRDLQGAAAAFAKSVEIEPGNVDAHLARIAVLRETGGETAAIQAVAEAAALFPTDARLHYAAALTLEDTGMLAEALAYYDRALSLDPALEDAWHNRGLLLSRAGMYTEASANQRQYLAAFPESIRAHVVLADILIAEMRSEEALEVLATLERLAPDDVSIAIRRGVAMAGMRRYDEARKAFSTARARDATEAERYTQRVAPGASLAQQHSPENLFVWQAWLALGRCDWSTWSALQSEMRRAAEARFLGLEPAAAFIAFHLPLTGAERNGVARQIAAGAEALHPLLPPPPARRAGRIRVGLLSPDLRDHLNAHLLLPLCELLDRSRFELNLYSLCGNDQSTIRAKLSAAADRLIDLSVMSDDAAANEIRRDDIDILIDVAGHTTGGRFGIVARRPARQHALYLGFAGSLGSQRVDYVVVDRVVAADEMEWTEKRVFLPHSYYLYDFRQALPQQPLARDAYDLPDNAFVYCAFHKAEKISPDTFLMWTRILRQVPGSILWLLALPDAAQRNLRREAAAHGVDPARLVFAPFEPRDRYLARQRLGDLMLDALHHNAMTTACDALAAGLPVLTLRGSAMSNRAGESLLRAAGLPELVAEDKNAFVAQAVQLASNRPQRAAYQRKLEARSGPLFDTAGRVRELETAFLELWDRYQGDHAQNQV